MRKSEKFFQVSNSLTCSKVLKAVEKNVYMVDEITESLAYLTSISEGAIIVISQKGNPESFVTGGVRIDSNVKKELLLTIFKKNSPLHDGAVVIKDGKMILASAVLPLSTNPDIDPNFGTRHRAAYGISEVVDSLVFVVSEERGQDINVQQGKDNQKHE